MLAIHAYWIHWKFYNTYNNGEVATICCQRKFPIPVGVSIGLDCTIMETYGMEKWEQGHTRWTEAKSESKDTLDEQRQSAIFCL